MPGNEIPGDPEQEPGDAESVARSICLRLLTERARSRAELATALARRGVPDDAAGTVLDRFTDVGLVDDAAFARQWVASRHGTRGLAGRALSQELRRKGVDPESAATALADLDPDTERRTARELVERKLRSMRGVPAEARLRRLMGMLARKGYGPGLAAQVVRAVLAEQPATDAASVEGAQLALGLGD